MSNPFHDRTEHIQDVADVLKQFGQGDYRMGQAIFNALRRSSLDKPLDRQLYEIENDQLLALLQADLKKIIG